MVLGVEVRVAAVIPVFERPTVVLEALESVLAQSAPPARLVVVDDGSTDGSAAAVEQWIERRRPPFPSELVRQVHAGPSAARNRAVESAGDVDLIAFLDSDDLWPPEYLEALGGALARAPGAVAASCDKDGFDAPSGRTRLAGRAWAAGDATAAIVRRGPPGISNTVIRAPAFRGAGGFDVSLETAEDLDVMLRLSLLGAWLHVPGVRVTYRHRLGETRGEAASLGHRHADRRRTRARVLERFLERERAALAGAVERELLRALARQWAKAGRQLAREGRRHEARDCFRRALGYRPLDLRSRWALLR